MMTRAVVNCFCKTTASARLWLYLKRLYFISSAIAYCISPYASSMLGFLVSVYFMFPFAVQNTFEPSFKPCSIIAIQTKFRSFKGLNRTKLNLASKTVKLPINGERIFLKYDRSVNYLIKITIRIKTDGRVACQQFKALS